MDAGSIRGILPPLRNKEQHALCRRWQEHHDSAAAEKLVCDHLYLIARIATAHRGCGLSTQTLIGEGYLGLMRAVCRYDPGCGTGFTTYATRSVHAAICHRVLRTTPSKPAATARGMTAGRPLAMRGGKRRASTHFASR